MTTPRTRPNSPAPGRRERRRQETRERLLRAALALLAERGFAATTVEAITERADVAKGTFFNHFPSKEHILAAFGQLQLGRVEAALADARAGRTSAAGALRRLPRELAVEPGRSPKLVRGIIQAVTTSDAVRGIVSTTLARGRRLLTALFRMAQREDAVRRDAPAAALALHFQRTFFGTLMFWALDGTSTLDRHAAAAFEHFWHGVAAGAAPRRKR